MIDILNTFFGGGGSGPVGLNTFLEGYCHSYIYRIDKKTKSNEPIALKTHVNVTSSSLDANLYASFEMVNYGFLTMGQRNFHSSPADEAVTKFAPISCQQSNIKKIGSTFAPAWSIHFCTDCLKKGIKR